MFLTRFLLVASLCIAAPLTALAAADETNQCVAGAAWNGGTDGLGGKAAGVYNEGTTNGMYADYIVYFKNAESTIKTGCDDEVKTMVDAINNIQGNLRGILMFATADGTGDSGNNKTYSRERLDTVEKALKDGGVNASLLGCKVNEGDKDSKNVCAKFYLGDAPWDDEDSHFERRAVYIFLIYKGDLIVNAGADICNQDMKNALSSLKDKLQGYSDSDKARTKLEELQNFCNGLSSGKEDQAKIDEFEAMFKAMVEAMPEGLKNEAFYTNTILQLKIARANKLYTDLVLTEGSVWKNADGTFNYHRLIADSAAGVVLGTAGGLLSSHLIKKAQIKEGFEDLQCTIGGQLVANWGDQFLPTMTVAP